MKIQIRPDEEIEVEVDWFDEYPRGEGGTCVLCKADPCGEYSDKSTPIWKIMHNDDGTWSGQPNCPVCEGRPV